MAAFAGDVSVFAHTTLDTRIAMNVSQDITAGAFKSLGHQLSKLVFSEIETFKYMLNLQFWQNNCFSDSSVGDFERVHHSCLPNSGEIQVNGIMLKRKSRFYYLPDSLPMKYVFHGMRSTWFLYVEASHIKSLYTSRLPRAVATTLSERQDPMTCNAKENSEEKTIHISKKKKKKKKILNEKYMQNTANVMQEGFSSRFEEKPSGTTNKSQVVMPENEVQNLLKLNANSVQGSLNEKSTEEISVTGIINKYFSSPKGNDNFESPSLSDATSRAVHKEIEDQPNTPKTPPNVLCAPSHADLVSKTTGDRKRESKVRKGLRVAASHVDLVLKTSRDKRKESKVRKRLLVASQGLGISANKCSPAISLCKFKDGELLQQKSQTKGSLFEISDSDD
ncbi:uncharacterized protein G2W53_005245 [Senna tora]|uniref:Uncharacterized protein n=1 Tax=Senna tora TaxID=362788 RepID=A0A834XER0_9FABA|nr:uncharacterized protein G2W53_005245 [Senna tora]